MIRANLRVKQNDFPEIAQTLEQRVADRMNNGIANYVAASDQVIPRETGAMAANKDIQEATPGDLNGAVGYNEEYSPYVHDGTVHQRAQPWARITATAMAAEYSNELRQAIEG